VDIYHGESYYRDLISKTGLLNYHDGNVA